MARTYDSIASSTSTGSSNTITFSSIASTYTDLIISGIIKGTNANDAYLRYNSDTGSNYSDTTLRGTGTTASSVRNTNAVGIDLGAISTIGATDVANLTIHIFNYSSTSVNKTCLVRFNLASNQTLLLTGLWRSTSAITSLSLFNRGGNWVSGTTFALYGIKAA